MFDRGSFSKPAQPWQTVLVSGLAVLCVLLIIYAIAMPSHSSQDKIPAATPAAAVAQIATPLPSATFVPAVVVSPGRPTPRMIGQD
jgi:hypothetical protein